MMSIDKHHTRIFYENLAYLFYAVAMADGKIMVEEKRKIIEYVKKYWSHRLITSDSDEIIYATLRTLIKEETISEDAYIVFKSFFLDNKKLFSVELRKKIMETSNGIAMSYSRKNKSELILLTKLHTLFKL